MSELMHYGVKGQKKGIRNYQGYEEKPTRSGMVGEERGDAAKEYNPKTARQQRKDEKLRNKMYSELDRSRVAKMIKNGKDIDGSYKASYDKQKEYIKSMNSSQLDYERGARRLDTLKALFDPVDSSGGYFRRKHRRKEERRMRNAGVL